MDRRQQQQPVPWSRPCKETSRNVEVCLSRQLYESLVLREFGTYAPSFVTTEGGQGRRAKKVAKIQPESSVTDSTTQQGNGDTDSSSVSSRKSPSPAPGDGASGSAGSAPQKEKTAPRSQKRGGAAQIKAQQGQPIIAVPTEPVSDSDRSDPEKQKSALRNQTRGGAAKSKAREGQPIIAVPTEPVSDSDRSGSESPAPDDGASGSAVLAPANDQSGYAGPAFKNFCKNFESMAYGYYKFPHRSVKEHKAIAVCAAGFDTRKEMKLFNHIAKAVISGSGMTHRMNSMTKKHVDFMRQHLVMIFKAIGQGQHATDFYKRKCEKLLSLLKRIVWHEATLAWNANSANGLDGQPPSVLVNEEKLASKRLADALELNLDKNPDTDNVSRIMDILSTVMQVTIYEYQIKDFSFKKIDDQGFSTTELISDECILHKPQSYIQNNMDIEVLSIFGNNDFFIEGVIYRSGEEEVRMSNQNIPVSSLKIQFTDANFRERVLEQKARASNDADMMEEG